MRTSLTGLNARVLSIQFVILNALTVLFAEKVKAQPFTMPFLPPLPTVEEKLTAQAAPVPRELPTIIRTSPFPPPTLVVLIRGGETTMPLAVPLKVTNLLKQTPTPPFVTPALWPLGMACSIPGGCLLHYLLLGSFTSV